MRILLSIHHELDPDSGAPGATLALGEALQELGHEVSYLSFDDLPVRLPFLAASVAFPYFAALKIAASAHRFDVVDASTGDAWVWGRLDRRTDRPLLVTRSHGLEHLFQQQEVRRAARESRKLSWRYPLYWGGWRLREVGASLRASDLVLVLNEEEREVAVERIGVPQARVRFTANGVPDSFLAVARETENPGGPAVAMVGAHRAAKGVDDGCRALTAALESDPELRVSMLGTGVPERETLARFPTAMRARINVTERYRRNELPRLLAGHSIALFPSLSEGFPLTLVETMACGVVPVATSIAGHRAVVQDGANGALVPTGEPDAAAAAVLRLRSEPATLARLRAAASATAAAFTWRRIARETARAYEEARELRHGAAR